MPPALWPALALLTGSVVAAVSDLSLGVALPALPVLWCAAAVCWWRRALPASFALVVVGCALAGFVSAAHARDVALQSSLRALLDDRIGNFLIDGLGPENDHPPTPVRARILEDAAVREDYVSLRVRVTSVAGLPAEGGVTLAVSGEAAAGRAPEWRAGRVIEVPATFRRPARYLNDGVPDLERRLALDGTTLFGSVKSGLLVAVVSRGSPFEEWAARVRAHVRTTVQRWAAPHDAIGAAIVTAVLIGDRTGLPDEVVDRLQRAGTFHVIAISGGNIAVLAGLVLGVLAALGLHGRIPAFIAIVTLLVFAGVATTGPSVWRATTMAVLYLAARLLDHRTPSWQATPLAAAVMAALAPLDVVNPGFVLTFGATCALIESARWIARRTAAGAATTTTRIRGWILASIGASLAVEIALMPVSATAFARVTLAGPVLNLLAVPLMAVAQVAGLVVVAAGAWPAIAGPAGWVAASAASAIVSSASLIDLCPGLSWRVPPVPVSLLAIYYASLLVLLFSRRRRIRLLALPAMVVPLLVIIGVIRGNDEPPVSGVRLTMLDVGQGESLLLESGRKRLQIDAGGAPFGSGSFDIGARVVVPALWARGVAQLDAVLLTHGDPDHIGGAPTLLEVFPPRQLWEGIVVPRHTPSRQLREGAAAAGVLPTLRRAGESFAWGRARIRVLHPPEPDWERPRVRNDDSVVLEVVCGDVALLLTGDIGADVEREIVPLLTPARIRILKVGHHGSRTSSSGTLLEAWRPQVALISAGRGNTFGHPAPEVLQRLESIGARIYRTDTDGQITLETDCRKWSVRRFHDDKR